MAREITIYGQTYELTDGMENYAKVKAHFAVLSEQYAEQYKENVESQCINAEFLIQYAYKWAEKYFEKAEEDILNSLAENGVYTVSRQDIENLAAKYRVCQVFDKAFNEIEEIYDEIIERAEGEKLQREIRKESRGRVLGGGFGLRGAAKGMFQAGLINGVTGMGHSIANAFGNARTEKAKERQLDCLYPDAKRYLQKAFKASISNYYVVLISLLEEFDIFQFECPTEQNKQQAKAILQNLSAGRIPQEKTESVLFQLVTLNPFSAETYYYILEKYGDSKCELEKFGEAHGLDVRSLKSDIIGNQFQSDIVVACENFEEERNPVQFEKELCSIQANINNSKKKLGLTTDSECDDMIKNEMKNLSIKYKTIDGFEFKTVEEAKAAKKDLRKFYEYVSLHGIELQSARDGIKKLGFKTNIVTRNLEKRLEEMRALTDDKIVGKRIEKILEDRVFSEMQSMKESLYNKKIFIVGVSEEFTQKAGYVQTIAGIPGKEKIILIFRNENGYGNGFYWWVLTVDSVYTFESNSSNEIEEKRAVSVLDIEFVRPDRLGNLVTRIMGGVDRTDKMGLGSECRQESVRENFAKAMEEIWYLIAPLSKNRSETKRTDKKKDIVALDVKKLSKDVCWQRALSIDSNLKEYACVNDDSSEFKVLLNKAKKYWDCTFEDETVYFAMVDGSDESSVVLTSARCYIYGKVGSVRQKFVFPVDRISTFYCEGKKNEYKMFFDVDYFKQNFFDCSSGCACFNNVVFKIYNISEDAGKDIFSALTSMEKEIRRPMLEKAEKREYFEKAIAEVTDGTKANELIKALNNDKILEKEERKVFLAKAQQKLDKCRRAEANARELEQMIASIKRDDLQAINRALNKLLKNELFDESDKKAITDLIEMQLEIGNDLYGTELRNFFYESSTAGDLILGKPVYMKKNSTKTALELCELFCRISPVLEEDEVPLVLFKNDSQSRSVPPSPPDAEVCLFSNKRLIVSFKGKNYDVYALNDIDIDETDWKYGNCIRANGKRISLCFPYVKLEKLVDRAYRNRLQKSLGDRNEHEVVAKELRTFVAAVYKATMEKNQMEELFKKLPTDGKALKSLSREALEKEYAEWEKYTRYGAKVTNYLALVEVAIKEHYKKEADELYAGLSEMSVDELKELKVKLENDFSNNPFASFMEVKNAVEQELAKKKNIAIKEEIAIKSQKLDSLTKAELEREFNIWKTHSGKEPEVKEFLKEVKEALKKIYKKEADELCAGLSEMSVDELKELKLKLENDLPNSHFSCFVEVKNAVEQELTQRKSMAIRTEISMKRQNLDSFTRAELEREYNVWKTHSGKEPEIKEFLQEVKEALEKVYKNEVVEMCADLEALSVKETRELLNTINNSFIIKSAIKEELTSVEEALAMKQEEELRSWMPEELDSLSLTELEGLLIKYNAGNYESALYVKYAIPVIERRNYRLIETTNQLIDFIESRASATIKSGLLIESKEKLSYDIKQQTEADADTLVCTIGTGNGACRIFVQKFECGQMCFPWEKLSVFDSKKKLFGGTLNFRCKDGTSGELNISMPSSLLVPMAELLNEIISYMSRMRGNHQNSTQGMVDPEQNVMPEMERLVQNVAFPSLGASFASLKTEEAQPREQETASFEPTTEQGELSKEYKAETLNLEEEYEALRPLVEPIMPVIDAQVARINGDYVDYKVMEWDGDPEVIRGEKAPILVVMHDVRCSSKIWGKGAIKKEAKVVLGILPDFFYIVNAEKFILYVKGQKHEWKISTLRELNFKSGLLSSSLLVTDVIGTQKKITISYSFQKHVDGLNKILAFLREIK